MEIQDKEIVVYATPEGEYPFWNWMDTLPRSVQAKIDARLTRVRAGNIGDAEPVGEGIHELRVHLGPGYRIYFVPQGQKIIILLTGSDKADQDRTIKKAKDFWKDYRSQHHD